MPVLPRKALTRARSSCNGGSGLRGVLPRVGAWSESDARCASEDFPPESRTALYRIATGGIDAGGIVFEKVGLAAQQSATRAIRATEKGRQLPILDARGQLQAVVAHRFRGHVFHALDALLPGPAGEVVPSIRIGRRRRKRHAASRRSPVQGHLASPPHVSTADAEISAHLRSWCSFKAAQRTALNGQQAAHPAGFAPPSDRGSWRGVSPQRREVPAPPRPP